MIQLAYFSTIFVNTMERAAPLVVIAERGGGGCIHQNDKSVFHSVILPLKSTQLFSEPQCETGLIAGVDIERCEHGNLCSTTAKIKLKGLNSELGRDAE